MDVLMYVHYILYDVCALCVCVGVHYIRIRNISKCSRCIKVIVTVHVRHIVSQKLTSLYISVALCASLPPSILF